MLANFYPGKSASASRQGRIPSKHTTKVIAIWGFSVKCVHVAGVGQWMS